MARKKSRKKRKHFIWRLLPKAFYIFLFLFVVLGSYIGYNMLQGNYGEFPAESTLKKIEQAQATEIYTRYGTLMGRYYFENRNNIRFDQIPSEAIHALIATEDARFFEHHGIDTRSLFRVFFRTILLGDESSGGGSTITQQLAKNLYPRQGEGHIGLIGSKLREMILAWKLEDLYPKKSLIQMYLNTVPFGENTFGIKNGSQLYFNKLPSKLKLEQACTLIGMLKGTSYYNPHNNPRRSLERRNVVISQMAKYGYLKPAKAEELMQKPLNINYHPIDHNNGLAPYLREYLRPKLKQWCENHKKPNGESYNLYTDGLKVYTTIDGDLQTYAKKAVQKHMPVLQNEFNGQHALSNDQSYQGMAEKVISRMPVYKKENPKNSDSPVFRRKSMEIFTWEGPKMVEMSPMDSVRHYLTMLHAGFLAMDPHNGNVLAWVGGIDHRFFKYDHVTSRRQIGSTFKPFVYANALKQGARPCDYYANDSIVYEDFNNWSPSNADKEYGGVYSLQGALVNSVNTVSVQLLMEGGIDSTIHLAKKLGITSDFEKVPSLALGTSEASVMDMTEAYTAFANGGIPQNKQMVVRIENSEGKIIETFEKEKENKRILENQITEQITMMLRNVVKRGTARSLSHNFQFTGDVAGKTGTTQDQADGWFIGYTPNIVIASWVGAEYPSIHFSNLYHGQGSATALPIAGYFLNDLYKHHPDTKYLANFQFNAINPRAYSCPDYRDEPPGFLENLLDDLKKKRDRGRKEKEKSFIKKLIEKLKKDKN